MELVLETPKSVRFTFKTTTISVLNFIIFQFTVDRDVIDSYWGGIIIGKPTDTVGATAPLVLGPQ